MIVPVIEIVLAIMWFLGNGHAWALAGVAALLGVFTIGFALHLVVGEAPDCHCFGLIIEYERTEAAARETLLRNMGLLGLLGVGEFLMAAQRGSGWSLRMGGARGRDRSAGGFTVVEMLVVIAVVAVLIGLVLPSLSGVRESARETGSMSNLRTHVQTMWAYTADYASLPVFSDPQAGGVIYADGRAIETDYFDESYLWATGLADEYYGGQLAHGSFFPPGFPYRGIPYRYTLSFLATPDFWNLRTRRPPYAQWRPVDPGITAFPADKGMFLNPASAYVGDIGLDLRDFSIEVGVGWVDGSASRQQYGQLRRPVLSGIGEVPGRQSAPFGLPVIDTIDGALGRDR